MRVFVSLLPDHRAIDRCTEVAVVIDVLRATSVMASALSAGAEKIITCREIEEATELTKSMEPRPLLCGERGCKPIDGFDLGNSPAEYTSQRVGGRTLVMTTTNGTRAIAATTGVPRVITASFTNLPAVLQSVRDARHIHLVCAGTEGAVTAEDVLLAGALTSRLQIDCAATIGNDDAILARQLWLSWFGSESFPSADDLSDRLRETQGGRNLLRVGYQDDLRRCAEIGSLNAVAQRVSDRPTTFVSAGLLAKTSGASSC